MNEIKDRLSAIELRVGSLVRCIRRAKGINLQDFASRCGFCVIAQMQRYETGENYFKFSHLVVIAEVLEVPLEVFLCAADMKSDEEYRELMSSFFSIEDSILRKTIISFIKGGKKDKKKR